MDTSTEVAPSLGEAAKAENVAIMTDPNHPMYEGFRRNDPRVNDYIDGLYRKAYGSAPVISGNAGIEVTTQLTPSMDDEASFNALLRTTFKEQYDATMRDMHSGAAHLVASPEHVKALDLFLPLLKELGADGEIAGVKFLAEIGRLHINHQGGM